MVSTRFCPSLGTSLVVLGLPALAALHAADPAHPDGWRHEARIGLQLNSVLVDNEDESRDSTIGGSRTNISYLANFQGALFYQQQEHSVVQRINLDYGRSREQGSSWLEDDDNIDYDGSYRYAFAQPQYGYAGWGVDSVFTGVDPDNEALDPLTFKVSAGYGQKREQTGDPSWLFDWQVGLRAQRVFGRGLGDDGREVQVGGELVVRYEGRPKEDLSYWLQYELFVEFDDVGNHRNLITGQLDYQLTKIIALSLSLRAYLEGEPDDAPEGAVGYDEFSVRQETLLGLLYEF